MICRTVVDGFDRGRDCLKFRSSLGLFWCQRICWLWNFGRPYTFELLNLLFEKAELLIQILPYLWLRLIFYAGDFLVETIKVFAVVRELVSEAALLLLDELIEIQCAEPNRFSGV